MKLLIATSDKQKGGIERALRDQYALLSCLPDCEISILSPEGALSELARQERVPHYLVQDYHKLMMRTAPFLSSMMLGRAQFDVILCHNGFMASALCRHTKRLIGICHNDKPSHFKAADELVCLTSRAFDKAQAQGWDKTKLHIIPHYQEAVIADKKPSNHSPLRVGCAGRMVAKKNLSLFVEIAEIVRSTHPEICFDLAGAGELEAEIKSLNKAKSSPVTMRGWVDFDQFLQEIDLLIIPSLDEPFGYVFIEAMSQGVGILASRTNGAHHCLLDGKIAPLFDADDAKGFADEIISLSQSKARLTSLKKSCLKRAGHDDFSAKTALKNWQTALYS